MTRTVLVACPQKRDAAAVRAAGLEARYDVRFEGPDLDSLATFDAPSLVDRLVAVGADGVVATKDRAALLAALVAERAGLVGPAPAALARAQHKLTSRELQREVAPEATPRAVALVPGEPPPLPVPFFAKPVVGRLSQGARRVDDAAELAGLDETNGYAAGWEQLARLAGFDRAASGFMAEELVSGREVTLEGYVHEGRTTVVGVTDSVKYPGTNSFERFEYPSSLPAELQAELGEIAAGIVEVHGFDGGFFNVEFAIPESGRPWILELNGRMASQFAPLVQALHGRSTYDALFALACGDDPGWKAGMPEGVAVSYVLRVFEDAFVHSVPESEDGVEVLVRAGSRLSEQGYNDAFSYRLAIVVGAGETREEAVARCRERAQALPFGLA
jgi:biotin carboxylase